MNTDDLARRILNSLKPPPAIDSRWANPPGKDLFEKLAYLLNLEWKDTPAGRRVSELLEIARQRKARGEKPTL